MRNTILYFVFATLLFAESVTMTIPANKEQFTNIAFLKTGQMFSIDHISGYATFSGDSKLRDAYGRDQKGQTCNAEGGMIVLEPGVEYVQRNRDEAPYFFARFAEKALGQKYHARGNGYLRVRAFDREGSYADNKHGSYAITVTIYPFEQKNSTIPTPQFHDDLAFHWAPIHYQDTAKEQWLADALTRVNYDGDWKTDNNWDALHKANSDLRGAVYYFVLETPSHWFVNYSFYHPRDWINPWDLETDHENDLEGIIVLINKDGSQFGKLEGIVTCAHLDFYSYIPEGSELQENQENIDGKLLWQRDHENNNRFCTYQEAKGHGCHALQKKHTFGSENDYLVYYPSKAGSVPESRFDQNVTYQLINIFAPGELWSRRFAKETFKKFGVFLKSKGSGGNANTPWTWDDKDDGKFLQGGEMALDPAQLFSIYYKTPQMVKEYIYNPFQGIWKQRENVLKRLLLFDIDSTLICSKGIWGKCFLEALQEVFPRIQRPQNVSFAGKTDLQICREILTYSNIPLVELEQNNKYILQSYEDKAHKAAQEYADKVDILPGVITLLQRLQEQQNITLTLLTGNIFVGAKIKLCCKNLDEFFNFEIGAWGDDNWDRYQLPAIAVSRAQKKLGISFAGKEVVIIGDTIHDINCGKSLGVRSIAVGTGTQHKNTLLNENPDFYFDNLEDDNAFLEAINLTIQIRKFSQFKSINKLVTLYIHHSKNVYLTIEKKYSTLGSSLSYEVYFPQQFSSIM